MAARVRTLRVVERTAQATAQDRLEQRIRSWRSEFKVASRIVIGAKPGPGSVTLAGNDYLAIGRHPKVVNAVADSVLSTRCDTFMSMVFLQYLEAQRAYEAAMARYLGAESAVLCQSGWAANEGLVQSIADSDMPVYIDIFAHASLWQGIHSSGAKPRPFRHNDPESLKTMVDRYGPGLVIVDAVYSTSGSVCRLAEIVHVAEAFGCMILVDESHAAGTRGPQGAGLVAELGLTERVDFRTMSLSKAFVGRGGLVAGPDRSLDYFRFHSRHAIFSSTVLPHEIAGFMAALEVVRESDERRAALKLRSDYLRRGLQAAGIGVPDHDSPIIALVAGSDEATLKLRDSLETRGVFGAVFVPPATPKGRSLVRLTVNSALTQEELDRVIAACAAARAESGLPQ